MLAYKGFEKGLICRGYQFKLGLNTTDKAHCVRYGFHCAENPLDCLSYYPNTSTSVYFVVDAGGDVDEDNCDSKISCTELNIIKELSLKELILHGIAYMEKYPQREWNSRVNEDRARASNGYAISRGVNPIATGDKIGDILAMVKESDDGKEIKQMAFATVDGKDILPGIWYDVDLKARKAGWL